MCVGWRRLPVSEGGAEAPRCNEGSQAGKAYRSYSARQGLVRLRPQKVHSPARGGLWRLAAGFAATAGGGLRCTYSRTPVRIRVRRWFFVNMRGRRS